MKRLLFVATLVFATAGCDQRPAEVDTKPTQPPVVQEENRGRSAPDAGGVERIVVQASGTGPAVQAAVNQAIRLAFEQVNGKSF